MPKRKPGSDSEEEDPPSAEEDSPPPSDAETEQAEEEAGGAEEEEYEDEVIDKKRYCFCRGFDDGTTMVRDPNRKPPPPRAPLRCYSTSPIGPEGMRPRVAPFIYPTNPT